MPNKQTILWVDDEQELLKPYHMFLESQGYEVQSVSNGDDALELIGGNNFDLVLLDEQMPGKSGLEVLTELKRLKPETPVVMMTKSEEMETMQSALGKQIDDYLVKPVSIIQLQASVKKILDKKGLVVQEMQKQFLQDYGRLTLRASECAKFSEWAELYKTIVEWEVKLDSFKGLDDTVLELKREVNSAYAKFVRNNYLGWVGKTSSDAPLMSHRILSDRIKPLLKEGKKVAFIVIDNFRLDQWEVIRPLVAEDFNVSTELYCGILPTATQYARNAIFSGLLPREIKENLPQFWLENSGDEESLNQYERDMLSNYFERQRMSDIKCAYYKVNHKESGENIIRKFGGYEKNNLNALVYNFVDMLSHGCTELFMLKQLISNDSAYRAATLTWFKTGTLHDMLLLLKKKGFIVVLTTDHGTIRVMKPTDITGDKGINSNMRFKTSKSMKYKDKEVFAIAKPAEAGLTSPEVSSSYVFALNDEFFVYPNDRNEYVGRYSDSFQHGGVSMEEMILPFVTLTGK